MSGRPKKRQKKNDSDITAAFDEPTSRKKTQSILRNLCASKKKPYREFHGRQWFFTMLLKKVTPPVGLRLTCEYFVLFQAPPGFGKSAATLQLIGHHSASDEALGWTSMPRDRIRDNTLASYFCDAMSPTTLLGTSFLSAIIDKLSTSCEGFEPDDDCEEMDAMRAMIEAKLGAMEPPDSQKFILVDGLDECLDVPSKQRTVIDVLARLRRKLPPWLTIFATARRDDDVTKKLRVLNANFVVDKGLEGWTQSKDDVKGWAKKHITQPLEGVQGLPRLLTLFANDPWTKELVLQYLETDERELILEEPVFGKLFLYVQDRGYRLFCHKADGNFQYARHALATPEDVAMAPISLLDLRPGLTHLYQQRYEAVFQDCMGDFDVYVKPILQVLLAANGPLPADLLSCAMVGTDDRKRERYMRMVQQLCRSVDNQKKAWKLTHKSYKDWFQEPGHDFSVDLVEGHRQLAHLSYKAENWVMDSLRGKYLLRHGVYHAVQCNEVAQARTGLMFKFKWLLERAKLGPPHALVQDGNRLAVYHTDRAFALLHSALRLMQPGLAKNPLQMAGQLVGRLMGYEDATVTRFYEAEIETLLATVRAWPGPDGRGWWCPFTQTYEPAGGACRMTMVGHSWNVSSVSFSPDGASIVSGSSDNTVKVWSVESGECVTTFNGHSLGVTSVSFSPDGAFIVSGS